MTAAKREPENDIVYVSREELEEVVAAALREFPGLKDWETPCRRGCGGHCAASYAEEEFGDGAGRVWRQLDEARWLLDDER